MTAHTERYVEGAGERLVGHLDIISALARRDLQSRFGENALGYAWTYVAPLAWVGATYLAFWIFQRTSPVYTDTITFIISGLIPFAAFRYVITAISRSIGNARGLMIFPRVTQEHAIITGALLEFANTYVVYAIVVLVNYMAFGNFELDNFLQFSWGLTLAWGLGGGYAYLFANLARIHATFAQLGPVLLRPAFFLSGVFFTANELPDSVLDVLGWNPLLQAIEIARDGMLFHYESRIASSAYVLCCILGLFAAGAVVNLVRRR